MGFEKTSAAFAELLQQLEMSTPEVSYSGGTVGDDFVLAPGKITIIGAPPGTGKTALASQIVFEALERMPDIHLFIANAEMNISDLLKRELARRADLTLKQVSRGLNALPEEEKAKLLNTFDTIAAEVTRTRHLMPPFNCEELKVLTLYDTPGILLVDYLQKFKSPSVDSRAGVDQVMSCLRDLASHGWAILALSATARSQSKKGGHDPNALSMSSFKDSGEIEFNADAAYLLRNKSDDHAAIKDIDLDCVKNRSGSRHIQYLRFHGEFMRFENLTPETSLADSHELMEGVHPWA